MEFDATFFIAIVSFVIFVFIMNAIFYAPVLNIIKKRNSYVEDNFSNAKLINEKVKNKENYHINELEKIRDNARNVLNSEMQRLNSEKSKAVSDYKSELHNSVSIEKQKLNESVIEAKEVLDNSVVDVAKSISNVLFGDNINVKSINKSQIKEE